MRYFFLLLLLPVFGHAGVSNAVILYNQHSYIDAIIALDTESENSAYADYWGGKIRDKMGDQKKSLEDYLNSESKLAKFDPTSKDALAVEDIFMRSPLYGDLFYQVALIYKSRGEVDNMVQQKDLLIKKGFKELAAKLPSKDDAILTAKMQKRLEVDMKIDSIRYSADWARVRCVEKQGLGEGEVDNFHLDYFYRKVGDQWASTNEPQPNEGGKDYGDTRADPDGVPRELANHPSESQILIKQLMNVFNKEDDRDSIIGPPSSWTVKFNGDWAKIDTSDGPAMSMFAYYYKKQKDGSWKQMNEPRGTVGLPMEPIGAPKGF